MANPRIDDLRRKIEREPGSRLFAQLAEELRKDGELAEAIRVARQGLDKHPNYPSARMTLGRALVDSGDLAAARREFETVLKGAPDNILASRFLAECLEGLGQRVEALARYKSTLAMAPGDKQLLGRIQALEQGVPAASAVLVPATAPSPAPPMAGVPRPEGLGLAATGQAAPAPPAAAPAAAPEPPEPAPIRLVDVDDEGMELMAPYEAPAAPPVAATPVPPAATEPEGEPEEPIFDAMAEEAAQGEAPIPLVPIEEEEFELERPYQAPTPTWSPASATAPPEPAPTVPEPDLFELEPPPLPEVSAPAAAGPSPSSPTVPSAPPPEPDVIEEEFDLEPRSVAPPAVTFRAIIEEPGPGATLERVSEPPPPAARTTEPELASPTLAELYFNQGFVEKAVEVYRRLVEREPGNDRLRARLMEIEAIQRHLGGGGASSPEPPADRREAVERAIARLLDLRAALGGRKG